MVLEETENQIALVFSDKKQLAILGHLLKDDKFFMFCKDVVKPNWFKNPHVGKAFEAKIYWFNNQNRIGTFEEIYDSPFLIAQGTATKIAVNTAMDEAIRQTKNYGLDAISKELTSWLHSQIFFQSVTKAQTLYNQNQLERSYGVVEEAIKNIRTTTFGMDMEERWDDWAADTERLKQERSGALTTGLTLLDGLLLPPRPGEILTGSLLPGDTTIIMAPVNTGKTTTAINFIVPNIMNQKHVLFLTHEGRPIDIKKKIRCRMLKCSERDLLDMEATAEGRQRLYGASVWLEKYLTYIPLNKAGQRVEDVVSTIRRKQDELAAKNNGRGYAMLVDDYPALLTCDQAKQGQLAKRNIDDIVYGNFVQLGLEFKMHVLAAIQVNREGSKINKNSSNDTWKPLLTMENVAESFSVMMQATNVITLNRDTEDKTKNRMTMYLDKSRSSETGYAVVCNTRFEHAVTHCDELGAVYYRGSTTQSDRIDDFLKQSNEKGYLNNLAGIPEEEWIEKV